MPDYLTPLLPENERPEPPMLAGDRESLESWLDFQREALRRKVGGLTGEQLCRRAVPPSGLCLLGLVRHLAEVEHFWFVVVAAGGENSALYCTPESEDGDFDDADPAGAEADLAQFAATVAGSRAIAAGIADLDAPVAGKRRGHTLNLRWIYVHLIEEYARHLGHADLLREAVDGVTGY